MSNAEFYLPGSIKWGVGGEKGMPRGHGDLKIWGLPFYDRIQRARVMSQPEHRYGVLPSMMAWAETAAEVEQVSREACDQWALESHQQSLRRHRGGQIRRRDRTRARSPAQGRPADGHPGRKPAQRYHPRTAGQTQAGDGRCLHGRQLLHRKRRRGRRGGHVGRQRPKKLGIEPLASFTACTWPATTRATPTAPWPWPWKRCCPWSAGTSKRWRLIEVQEAFAAQVLADLKEMGVGPAGLRQGQRQWFRHLAGPPHRLHRHPRAGQPAARNAAARHPHRPGVHLRRRRAGHCRRAWSANNRNDRGRLGPTTSSRKGKWISNYRKNMKCSARPFRILPKRKSRPSWTSGMPITTCRSRR
jgi:hypothetical protein